MLAGVVAICPALFSTVPNTGREFFTSDKARCTSSVRGLPGCKIFLAARWAGQERKEDGKGNETPKKPRDVRTERTA